MSSSDAAGPSRRSHTKSRKGCKTCKRRHIRCDESFPQCRNCSKHQVRCDYMESAAIEGTPPRSSPAPSEYWSGEIETTVTRWHQQGEASLGVISVDLSGPGQDFSKNDLQMLYTVLEKNQPTHSDDFMIRTHINAETLAIAASQPFLMHAILGFTASFVSFAESSATLKNHAYHHRGIALNGLLESTQSLSAENVDAVLLATVLLGWQAVDWQGWLTFIRGIQTVTGFTRAYQDSSSLSHVIDEQESMIPDWFPGTTETSPTDESYRRYTAILQQIGAALERLLAYLAGREHDIAFVERLIDYIRRLQAAKPAHTPEEQFNHLHAFRKWLFWIPPMVLKSSNSEPYDEISLVVLSYLYATALQLEPLYPNVAAVFCSQLAVEPLTNIIQHMDTLPQSSPNDRRLGPIMTLLAWPRQALAIYRPHTQEDAQIQYQKQGIDVLNRDLSYSIESQELRQHSSPAFGAPTVSSRGWSHTSSISDSSFLDVPQQLQGASTGNYSLPSSTFTGMPFMTEPEDQEFRNVAVGISGGCVSPQMLWT